MGTKALSRKTGAAFGLDLERLMQSLTSPSFVSLQKLLLLSPLSLRRSKTRFTDHLEMAEEPVEPIGSRWQCKSRTSQLIGFFLSQERKKIEEAVVDRS
ncbi:hypothetical protein TorRG33x02_193700 [Trema orientale]|uniref:Uncharacterized protein n=1 Tax=Trema orientale TaxID=63057 RepID=A0A2P5EH04_TREOI|nr:hypothetical protein TorRG33x02_193700 [Trema orientale]